MVKKDENVICSNVTTDPCCKAWLVGLGDLRSHFSNLRFVQAVLGLRTTRPFRPVHTVFPGLIEIESSPAKLQVQHKFRRHCPINFSKRTFGEAIKTNEDYTGGAFVSLGDLTMDIKKENSRKICPSSVGIPDADRFAAELEFVQCLASPAYLNWLAQNLYFEDPAFVNFLSYLSYWTRPEYAAFVIYPHALYFLHLLQRREFRDAIGSPAYKDLIQSQQFYHWQYGK